MDIDSSTTALIASVGQEVPMTDEQAARAVSRVLKEFAGDCLRFPRSNPIRAQRNANIRRDRKRGDTYTVLANRYDLSRAQICAIVHRDLSK